MARRHHKRDRSPGTGVEGLDDVRAVRAANISDMLRQGLKPAAVVGRVVAELPGMTASDARRALGTVLAAASRLRKQNQSFVSRWQSRGCAPLGEDDEAPADARIVDASGAAKALLSVKLKRLGTVGRECQARSFPLSSGKSYAVRKGLIRGVFVGLPWEQVAPFVIGVAGAVFFGFRDAASAERCLREDGEPFTRVTDTNLQDARRRAGLPVDPSWDAAIASAPPRASASASASAGGGGPARFAAEEEDEVLVLDDGEDGDVVCLDGATMPDGSGEASPKRARPAAEEGLLPPGRYEGWFDGASKRNPGPAGWGAAARGPGGSEVLSASGAMGTATNNVAEYCGMHSLLRLLLPRLPGGSSLHVRGDSKLVLNQVSGRWRASHPDMRQWCRRVRALVDDARGRGVAVTTEHVRRHLNADADALASAAAERSAAGERD